MPQGLMELLETGKLGDTAKGQGPMAVVPDGEEMEARLTEITKDRKKAKLELWYCGVGLGVFAVEKEDREWQQC